MPGHHQNHTVSSQVLHATNFGCFVFNYFVSSSNHNIILIWGNWEEGGEGEGGEGVGGTWFDVSAIY